MSGGAAALLAVVRAAAPALRSRADALAFALHAAVLSSGYRLVAVGEDATLEGLSADAPDAPVAGWDASAEQYAFGYVADAAAAPGGGAVARPAALLLKVLSLGGDALLATLTGDAPAAPPAVLELALDEFVAAPSGSGGAPRAGDLRNMDRLAAAKKQRLEAAGCGAAPEPQQQQRQPERGAAGGGDGDDPLRIGPPRRPLRVGQDDIMPMLGGGGGVLPPGGMRGPVGGGGMHVGPGHPFFADRMRHPDLMPGGGGGGLPGGPGGARWDPINPEGLEGWRPDDFQRPRPGRGGFGPGRGGGGGGFGPGGPDGMHPDLAPPGPGRGPDWDSMFG
ncbi:proteasome inhibitor [Scenedesmus sp. PABB004]|nr:proteasome inhibitor [Scenedesmus sp. PABB004]